MASIFRRAVPIGAVLAAALAGAMALGADKSAAAARRKPTPAPAPTNSCKTCVERRPILDGAQFSDKSIYEPEAPAGYQVAREMPATIDRLHCFCECAENPQLHHKTLLTCFTERHAAGCGICVKEALLAKELKGKGASDQEIVTLVESMFRTEGHPPTHTAHTGR
jgi:uncharacterized protein with PCYCGC motif